MTSQTVETHHTPINGTHGCGYTTKKETWLPRTPVSFLLQVCECLGLSWAETIPQQFDNVAVSLLTLFEISTTEAWTSVTYAAVDASGVGMQPIRDHVIARVWLFILFMLLGAYLVMNLFVGVIVDNFKKVVAACVV